MTFPHGQIQVIHCVFLSTHVKRHKMLICSLTGCVHFEHLIKDMSARFLYYNVTIFPFIINKVLMGRKVNFSLNKAVLE